jgi:hypothetical protein
MSTRVKTCNGCLAKPTSETKVRDFCLLGEKIITKSSGCVIPYTNGCKRKCITKSDFSYEIELNKACSETSSLITRPTKEPKRKLL